jgi:hypothetical protein
LRVRIPPGTSFVSVACGQVEVSASVWSLVQKSPKSVVFWVWSWRVNNEESLDHWGCCPIKNRSTCYPFANTPIGNYATLHWINFLRALFENLRIPHAPRESKLRIWWHVLYSHIITDVYFPSSLCTEQESAKTSLLDTTSKQRGVVRHNNGERPSSN